MIIMVTEGLHAKMSPRSLPFCRDAQGGLFNYKPYSKSVAL